MSKQDRQGVRTAADLERKYDFSSMKRAVEMHEAGINKTNKTLDEFVNATMRNFLEMRSELDSKAEIWFYDGAPTLENEPASEWEDYSLHLGDLYYDPKTGYGYRFKAEDGVYSWEQITDQDTIYALALANSAKDTADNNRSVFVDETPTPPYSVGDLWLKDNTLYVCQIAKAEGEEYETADFILASKYADGIATLELGAKLERDYSTTTEMQTLIEANNEKFSVSVSKQVTEMAESGIFDGKDGEAGEDATTLRIDSSRGTVFKNNTVSTVLSAVIYKGAKRITDITALKEEYGNNAYLEWQWQRMGEDKFGTIVSTDNRIGNDGFTLTLSPDDVDTKVVFLCNLITD